MSACDDAIDVLFGHIHGRRSIRKYEDRPVDAQLVRRLCEAALWAPSNWNGQPWQLVVLDAADVRRRVCELLDERVDAVERESRDDLRMRRFIEHCRRYFDVLHGCPVMILVCYKPLGQVIESAVAERLGGRDAVAAFNPNLLSLGMAVQNFLLAAHAAGLGACFHSGPVAFLRGAINERLGLPRRLELAGIVTLGWPNEAGRSVPGSRKPLAHLIKYGGGGGAP